MENFKNAFYPYWISESKKLDTEIKKSETLGKFKVWIMKFIKIDKRSTMNTWLNRHTIRNKARLDFGQLNKSISNLVLGMLWVPCVTVVLKQNLQNISVTFLIFRCRKSISKSIITYLKSIKHFQRPLINQWSYPLPLSLTKV